MPTRVGGILLSGLVSLRKATLQTVLAAALAGGASGQMLAPRGSLIRPGIDSLAVFFIRGNDTSRTGIVRDETMLTQLRGQRLLRRVYEAEDKILGTRIDTLVDDADDLSPVSHRSRTTRQLELLEFSKGRVVGWMRLANGDSLNVDIPLAGPVYNSSTFDLILRASPLDSAWQVQIPCFVPSTRSVVVLDAKVVGSELIEGETAWKVLAHFGAMPVSFWIGRDSRRLLRQLMVLRSDQAILFASPFMTKLRRAS